MNMNRPEMEMSKIARQDILCEARAKDLRERNPELRSWAAGNSVIAHGSETQCRVHDLVDQLAGAKPGLGEKDLYRLFAAADDIASAAMWAVVHMTYTQQVHIDGRPLEH